MAIGESNFTEVYLPQFDLFGNSVSQLGRETSVDVEVSLPIARESDVSALEGCDPILFEWLTSRLGPKINLVIESLIHLQLASDTPSALSYISDHFGEIYDGIDNLIVPTAFHLRGKKSPRSWSRLRQVVGKNGKLGKAGFYRISGTHGHGVAAGRLKHSSLDCSPEVKRSWQPRLFYDEEGAESLAVERLIPHDFSHEDILDGDSIGVSHLGKIKECVGEIKKRVGDEEALFTPSIGIKSLLKELRILMVPLVPNRFINLVRHSDGIEDHSYLIDLSLLGWASILFSGIEKDGVAICWDIPDIDPFATGVRGGRPDFLKVCAMGGSLSAKQRNFLGGLISQKLSSTSEVILALADLKEEAHDLNVIHGDIKMWLGDHPLSGFRNQSEQIAVSPHARDKKQMVVSSTRMLAGLSASLGNRTIPDTLLAKNPFQEAELDYVQPFGVITHRLSISPDDQEVCLRKFANSWDEAENIALMGSIDGAVVKFILGQCGRRSWVNDQYGIGGEANQTKNEKGLFRWKVTAGDAPHVAEVIQSFRD